MAKHDVLTIRLRRRVGRSVAAVAVSVMIVGCGDGSGRDVSQHEPYASLIGAEYRVVGDVNAYGITKDLGSGRIDHVTLIAAPGISGPEVLFKKAIRTGTTFHVTGIRRVFRPFDNDLQYVVQLDDSELPVGVEVEIDLLGSNEGSEGSNGWLNPAAYEKVKR